MCRLLNIFLYLCSVNKETVIDLEEFDGLIPPTDKSVMLDKFKELNLSDDDIEILITESIKNNNDEKEIK